MLYCTVKVKVTVAVWEPVSTVAPLVGFTPTPMKRVRAVPLTTPAAPTVSAEPVPIAEKLPTPAGTVLEFAVSRTM